MELTLGWCLWYVSEDSLIKCMTRLDEAGINMSEVKVTPSVRMENYYVLLYKNTKPVPGPIRERDKNGK